VDSFSGNENPLPWPGKRDIAHERGGWSLSISHVRSSDRLNVGPRLRCVTTFLESSAEDPSTSLGMTGLQPVI
jgi:hypothetical protein